MNHRIGIMGGYFNPPHAGHRHAATLAMHHMGLDAVWWMVAADHPWKMDHSLPDFAARFDATRRYLVHSTHFMASDFEARHHLRYSYDTLSALTRQYPAVHFYYIMGMDQWLQFHRWNHWRDIAESFPLIVIDRGEDGRYAPNCPAALYYKKYCHFTPYGVSQRSICRTSPHITLIMGSRHPLSSTLIRNTQHATRAPHQ